MPKRSMALGIAAGAALSMGALSSVAFAAPCGTAFFSSYLVPGFSCTVEDKTLSGFTYTQSPGAPSPSVVTIAPLAGVLHNPGLVFNFTGVFTVPAGSTVTLPFGFNIAAPATDPITDASLAVTGTVTGDGSIVDTETFGGAGAALMVCIPNAAGCTSNATGNLTTSLTTLAVTDTVQLVGAATLTTITKNFSETPTTVVPEPASLALLGAGLSAFGLFRRRRRGAGSRFD